MTISEALEKFQEWSDWGYQKEEIPRPEVLDKALSALIMTEHEDGY